MSSTQYSLVLYDTSDFEKCPIGGQLTSIRNFLRFLAERHPEETGRILLVGITTEEEKVGKLQKVMIQNVPFAFLPVLYRSPDLNAVQKSLRAAYLKALCGKRRLLPHGKEVVHYLHTPEAFIYLKMFHPFCKTAVFSHGSFFNMVSGFRFYQNSSMVGLVFNGFIKSLLHRANLIFTLDKISTEQYRPYNANVVQVENSVVLPEKSEHPKVLHDPVKLLFVGRLSRVKGIEGIIHAVAESERTELTIVGDGEERENLLLLVKNLHVKERIHFAGVVEPAEVSAIMDQHDILVMNSTMEGKPMTIIEALAHGLPVIATPVGGISEMVRNGEDAVLTAGQPDEIVDAENRIRSEYSKFSENARKASLRYDYMSVNDLIYRHISEMMK